MQNINLEKKKNLKQKIVENDNRTNNNIIKTKHSCQFRNDANDKQAYNVTRLQIKERYNHFTRHLELAFG